MFACSYDFDIEIEIDGIRCGSFQGEAELQEDCGAFCVTHISLAGEKVERVPGSAFPKRTATKVRLTCPPFDGGGTFKQKLYRRIEQAIYSSEHARDFFAEQLAMEAAA